MGPNSRHSWLSKVCSALPESVSHGRYSLEITTGYLVSEEFRNAAVSECIINMYTRESNDPVEFLRGFKNQRHPCSVRTNHILCRRGPSPGHRSYPSTVPCLIRAWIGIYSFLALAVKLVFCLNLVLCLFFWLERMCRLYFQTLGQIVSNSPIAWLHFWMVVPTRFLLEGGL